MKHTWTHPISSTSHSRGRFIPNSEVGNAIEKTCREPGAVGRVTPCAPRLQPAGAKFPRRRLPDPQPIKTLLEFPVPTSKFGFIRVHSCPFVFIRVYSCSFVVKNPRNITFYNLNHPTEHIMQVTFFKLLRPQSTHASCLAASPLASLSPQWGEGLRVRGGDTQSHHLPSSSSSKTPVITHLSP